MISASQEVIWNNIVNFERQALWSPWLIMESTCKRTLTGQDGQVGTVDRWEGEVIGTGERENTKIIDGEYLDQDLRFEKPWKSKARTYTVVQKMGQDEFQVTWGMQSKLPFFLFFMEKMFRMMIEKDYDRGLKMLKTLSETGKLETSIEDKGISEAAETYWVGLRHTCHQSQIQEMMTADFMKLGKLIGEKTIAVESFRSYYPKVDMKENLFSFESVITLQKDVWEKLKDLPEGMQKGQYGATKTYTLRHNGSYDFLPNTWSGVFMYLRAKKLKQNKTVPPFEVYVNDPMNTPADQLITDVSVPIK